MRLLILQKMVPQLHSKTCFLGMTEGKDCELPHPKEGWGFQFQPELP
jgi:hypothetical protein